MAGLIEVRPFVLAMTFATSVVACANRAPAPREPTSERAVTGEAAAPGAPLAPPESPPPAPVIAPNEVAGIAPPSAPLPAAPGPAEVGKDEDELANVGPSQAELEAQAREDARAAAKDKAKWARLAHAADRRATEDWSREHVQKAAARATELQNQSSRIPPRKRDRFRSDMTTFLTRKSEALSRINSLSATGSDEWKITKAELDRVIQEMDAALARLEGDF